MALPLQTLQRSTCLRQTPSQCIRLLTRRFQSTILTEPSPGAPFPLDRALPQSQLYPDKWILPIAEKRKTKFKKIPIIRPPQSIKKACPEPMKTVAESQIAILDPKGSRTRLFSRKNPEAARVGDILLVRQVDGEPFAGVCISIRRRGADTSILLRNHFTRIGVEMYFKVYSPRITSIEIAQRSKRRIRRAKLYYMRDPAHDLGSVEKTVQAYLRQRSLLGASTPKSGLARSKDTSKSRR